MPQAERSSEFAVEFRNVSKRFGQTLANDKINLQVKAGSIHGIVGENGAGKSTAMNMLYGFYLPDEGDLVVNGQTVKIPHPEAALALGIGMVHQHFLLSKEESALDNILLGAEPTQATGIFKKLRGFFKINRSTGLEKLKQLSKTYGFSIPLEDSVENLSVGQQQRVEILKVLYRSANIFILDEPTAVLTPQETEQMFAQLKKLKAEGKTVLIITHKLREVLSICDAVSVFRQGRVVAERKCAETSESELAELMVGRHIDLHTRKVSTLAKNAPTLLSLEDLSLTIEGVARLKSLSLQLRAGEILGIAGVQGNGQSEVQNLLLGPEYFFSKGLATGSYLFDGKNVSKTPTEKLFQMGLASVADDRLRNGAIASLSLEENFTLGLHKFPRFSKNLFLKSTTLRDALIKATKIFDIKFSDIRAPLSSLSGGNQQKLVMARELEKNPLVLIAAQPTRGVDVGAIEFIHQKLREHAASGMGIILISSELSELFALSHRIVVMYKGQINANFDPDHCVEADIGLAMGGVT